MRLSVSKFVGLMTKEERGEGMRNKMEEQDNDNNSEEGEEGEEEEVLDLSSDDDEDGIVGMRVRGSRTRTRNPRVFHDDFV
jgi:hypothetical protein